MSKQTRPSHYERKINLASNKIYVNQDCYNKREEEFRHISNGFNLELHRHIEHEKNLNKNNTFDDSVKSFYSNKSKTEINDNLKQYAINQGWFKFFSFLIDERGKLKAESNYSEEIEDENFNEMIINWKDLDQVDFLKLFQSLIDAKYLIVEKGKKTKLFELIAHKLNFELGKGWKENKSKNKNYSNDGYNPAKIFDTLKQAYIDNNIKSKEN